MNIKTHIISSALSVLSFTGFAQLDSNEVDSLMNLYVFSFDSSGLVKFKPNTLPKGHTFTLYSQYFVDDTNNTMVLASSMRDPFVTLDHDKYQQHYKGIPIEGAYFIEHSESGYAVYANGMIANLDEDINDTISKWEALSNLDQDYPWPDNPVFAWESEEWEEELRNESGNPDTTYFPYSSGKLVFALWNYGSLGYEIPSENLRLAYAFDVLSVKPFFHNIYYVDARTGEVFQKRSKIHYDGPATIPLYGEVTIDTKSRGWPYNDHILKAEGGDHNFHTKYYGETFGLATAFSLLSEIDDNDDDWGTTNQRATASHWALGQAWDYFSSEFGHEGMKGNGKKVKLKANHETLENAYYRDDDIVIGIIADQHLSFLDVIGHEFSHGVDDYSADLVYEKEPGALDESFADIFGFMVERFAENPNSDCTGGAGDCDWLVLEDLTWNGLPWPQRNMLNPNALDQPDTYEDVDDFWFDITNCDPECDPDDQDFNDCCGVHTNSGVQNRWFSLLALGGTLNGVTVTPIGIDDAALIAFFNLRFNLSEASGFAQARIGSIAAAESLFGACSQRHRSTADAWDAVGVIGTPINCFPLSTDHLISKANTFELFPNPSQGTFQVSTNDKSGIGRIEILSIDGKLIEQFSVIGDNFRTFNINVFPGIYLVKRISESGTTQVQKLIVK